MDSLAPVLLSDLDEYEPIPWFWEGFAAPFRKTIFVGHPKAGKTTLMSHLVKGLSGVTTNVGPTVLPTTTLILTEEHEDLWKRRRDDLGINGTQVWIQRIQRTLSQNAWDKLLGEVGDFCSKNEVGCVIIDTLSALWPALDENDAISVGRALDPINDLANDGLSVICVHHAPKAKQSAVISARGSTAITAFFDIVVNMRVAGKGSHSTRRALKAWGRDLETPESLMLDYDGTDGYRMALGDDDDDEYTEQLEAINVEKVVSVLIAARSPQTTESLKGYLKMAKKTLLPILDRAVATGKIIQTGSGVRGQPFHYALGTAVSV